MKIPSSSSEIAVSDAFSALLTAHGVRGDGVILAIIAIAVA